MKRHRLLILSLLVVTLLVGGCSLSLRQAKRQYALNRHLIAALVLNDTNQAIALVNAGADPNTHYKPTPAPTFKRLLNQLLHRSPVLADDSPTAFLLACGMDWNPMNGTSKARKHTPADLSLVQAMLRHGVNLHMQLKGKPTPLIVATLMAPIQVIELLLANGAYINEQGPGGMTPLMWAVMNDSPDKIRLLLAHHAKVNVQDGEGSTALAFAILSKNYKNIIQQLLEHGADPNLVDADGNSPLSFSQKYPRPGLSALLHKGAQ